MGVGKDEGIYFCRIEGKTGIDDIILFAVAMKYTAIQKHLGFIGGDEMARAGYRTHSATEFNADGHKIKLIPLKITSRVLNG